MLKNFDEWNQNKKMVQYLDEVVYETTRKAVRNMI